MQNLRSVLTLPRLLALNAIVVVGGLALVLGLKAHTDALRDVANAAWVLDPHGNPWLPHFRVYEAQRDGWRTLREAVLWAGVLPADVSLLGLSVWGLVGRKYLPAAFALLIASAVAFLLYCALLAAGMPSGGMIG